MTLGAATTRTFERHYKTTELADQWSLSPKIIRKIFVAEPGVLKVDRPEPRNKRGYCSLRIPKSVTLAVYKRMSV